MYSIRDLDSAPRPDTLASRIPTPHAGLALRAMARNGPSFADSATGRSE